MSLNKTSFYSLSSLFGDLWMNNDQLLKGGGNLIPTKNTLPFLLCNCKSSVRCGRRNLYLANPLTLL